MLATQPPRKVLRAYVSVAPPVRPWEIFILESPPDITLGHLHDAAVVMMQHYDRVEGYVVFQEWGLTGNTARIASGPKHKNAAEHAHIGSH